MSNIYPSSPADKKEYITALGKILVEEHGKKKYYKPEEVKNAQRKMDYTALADFAEWGMSIFSSHSDFDSYHQETGDTFDYIGMKTEMLSGLSDSPDIDWAQIGDIDIDASWLDFGDVFDGILEGIGAILGGIFD